MNLAEYKGVYIYAQQVDNVLTGISFELLGKAKDLAAVLNTEVTAVLIGSEVKGLVDELAAYGADRVIFGTDFPMWKQEEELEFLFDLGLSEDELKSILHDNLANLLNIE